MDREELKKYRYEVEKELNMNILPFWAYKALDEENGGFYGSVLNDLTTVPHALKGSVLYSRILWTFSRAYILSGEKLYLDRANRAYLYLRNIFLDNEYGGVYWSVDYKGNPVEVKKQIYAQAFAIYAFSEFYSATGFNESINFAKDIFILMEKFSFDRRHGGYYDAFNRDWTPTENMQLGSEDLNAPKSMNTSLHILEAYTNLLRSSDNRDLRNRLKNLVNTINKHIIDSSTYHFKLFFNENWESLSDTVSYGHDIEGSWLLLESAEVLNEKPLIEDIKKTAIKMAEVTLREGVAPDGGLWYEGSKNGVTNFNSDWWPQAEAMVGFLNAYQISSKEHFLDASLKSWEFIKKYLIDKKYGEWFWSVDKNRNVRRNLEKAGLWKCPYHNARACMEVMERLNHILNS
jgi:mannobiose 2-epimerase